jgi:hypothetical protein
MSDTKFRQYFSKHRFITTILPNGKRIQFTGGVYFTKSQDEIDYLEGEIKNGSSFFFVRKGEETISDDDRDPLNAIKRRAVEEYLQKQEESKKERDMGSSSIAGKLAGLQTTKSIAATAVAVSGSPTATIK